MSDLGIYAAMYAELLAALQTPTITVGGVAVDVVARCDLITLHTRETLRDVGIGITIDGAKFREAYGVANKMRGADAPVLVSIAVRSARGLTEQRQTLETLLETVRDRINFLATATSSKGKYAWASDSFVEIEGSDKAGAIAEFRLQVNFGI